MRNNDPIGVKHFCNPGDLIAAMASLKAYHEITGRKVIVYQQLNVMAEYYQGAVHGTLSDGDNATPVCMNRHIFDMIKPLITSQEYIEDMRVYEGQRVLIDIDVIRKQKFVNLPHGDIQSWVAYAYPDLAPDLSKPWITLPEKDLPVIDFVKDKIIINLTERYRNGHIEYFFLRKYKHRLIFAGTEKEHLLFCNAWGIDMPRLEVKDFLELAYAIKYCKYLLANQSMCWGISRAMLTPHILEVCQYAVNCLPFHYKQSKGFYHQDGLEHYVDIMTT